MNTASTVIKKLPFPWKVGGQEVTEVELRTPVLEDLIEAEQDAHPATRPNAYNVAIACRTMVRAGSVTGPFVASHFKPMNPRCWYVIRDALVEAENLGEDVQSIQAQQG